jgi:hypothetical protein
MRHSDAGGYAQTGDWLLGAVKRHPEGFLLLAAGCALMMRNGGASRSGSSRQSEPRRYDPYGAYSPDRGASRSYGGTGQSIAEGMSQTMERAGEYAADMKDRVAETASAYTSSVSEYADEARRSVSEHSERIARQAQSSLQEMADGVLRSQPLAVALAGFAAGAAVAAAFPATEIERRTLGDAGEKLTEAAGQVGEQLKQATAKAGERLKSGAQERGLSADTLTDMARDAAGAFGSAFTGEQPNEDKPSDQSNPSRGSGASGERAAQAGSPGAGSQWQGSADASRSPGRAGNEPGKFGR